MPLLPLRNTVVFPGMIMPLIAGRRQSVAAVRASVAHPDKWVAIFSQRDPAATEVDEQGIYSVGTICMVERVVEAQRADKSVEESALQLVVRGVARARLERFEVKEGGYAEVDVRVLADVPVSDEIRREALLKTLKGAVRTVMDLSPDLGEEVADAVESIPDLAQLTNLVLAFLRIAPAEAQLMLEEGDEALRVELLLRQLRKSIEVLTVERDLVSKISGRMTDERRRALLEERLRAIKEELGEGQDHVAEDLEKRIREAGMPESVEKIALEELSRLSAMPQASAEYHVIQSYLTLLVELPWKPAPRKEIDLERAERILDQDHFGLEDVKKRILQYLAVAKLKGDTKGPILCLVGPPGVGKTSLGQSVARALDRKFVRTSLGGIRDEAEIRGHRRTYVGAMPGRIIQGVRRAGVNDPVMMLDEIDKLGIGLHGDPASAMLEVLDPEQNHSFVDHYLDVPFDLSRVFFIATANVIETIPPPLLDRMEIIEVHSYTAEEKFEIARRHLIPKQLAEHGLAGAGVTIEDDAIEALIASYTREAGVRNLNREIANLCRHVAQKVVSGESGPVRVGAADLEEILGPRRFRPETLNRVIKPGVATGLAWTPVGGEILFIEASALPGTGRLTLTGQLGDVMKESAQIALSLVRSLLPGLGTVFEFERNDIHIHVPAGALPKDGPSAGVALFTALMSLLLGRTVDSRTAMTGEVTLRGLVLPVGGVKEKVLAARRAGVRRVLIPEENTPDLRKIPAHLLRELEVVPVRDIDQVMRLLFAEEPAGRSAA